MDGGVGLGAAYAMCTVSSTPTDLYEPDQCNCN